MKNILNKIFTNSNFEIGIMITLLIGIVILSIMMLGWKILLVPIAIISIALIGFVTKFIMDKITDLNDK